MSINASSPCLNWKWLEHCLSRLCNATSHHHSSSSSSLLQCISLLQCNAMHQTITTIVTIAPQSQAMMHQTSSKPEKYFPSKSRQASSPPNIYSKPSISERCSQPSKILQKCKEETQLDQVNCAKVKYSHYIVYYIEKCSPLKKYHPWKIFFLEN